MATQSNIVSLINSVEKAKTESMQVIEHAGLNGGYIVVHNDKAYMVSMLNEEIVHCTCPHHIQRQTICKHMIKVALEKGHDIIGISCEGD